MQGQMNWLSKRLDIIENKVDEVESKLGNLIEKAQSIGNNKLAVGGVVIAAIITGFFTFLSTIYLAELKQAQEISTTNRQLLNTLIDEQRRQFVERNRQLKQIEKKVNES